MSAAHSRDPVDAGGITDALIETRIFSLLADRAQDASICPSEVARALATSTPWRSLMPRIREVAGQLADNRRLVVTRKGVSVNALNAGGPIRLALPVEGGKT